MRILLIAIISSFFLTANCGAASGADAAIVIAYPDFEIATPVGKFDLGHAAVIIIEGKSGLTKYYEYGRYDTVKKKGLTLNRVIPDVKMGIDGKPTPESLKSLFKAISAAWGKNSRVAAAYVEAPGQFDAMRKYCESRIKDNNNEERVPYSIFTNNCAHFAKQVVEASGMEMPEMTLIPTPETYIDAVRDKYPNLDWQPDK